MSEPSFCPVCHARFRGAAICSRCGADLGRLMVLTAEAWRLRQAARLAMTAGELERGLELAVQAQAIRATPQGKALRTLIEWAVQNGVVAIA